jgi:hypothetical protein
MKFGSQEMLNIIGTVPSPNRPIKRTLLSIDVLSIAAAKARYTKPQGSKPLSSPIENSAP